MNLIKNFSRLVYFSAQPTEVRTEAAQDGNEDGKPTSLVDERLELREKTKGLKDELQPYLQSSDVVVRKSAEQAKLLTDQLDKADKVFLSPDLIQKNIQRLELTMDYFDALKGFEVSRAVRQDEIDEAQVEVAEYYSPQFEFVHSVSEETKDDEVESSVDPLIELTNDHFLFEKGKLDDLEHHLQEISPVSLGEFLKNPDAIDHAFDVIIQGLTGDGSNDFPNLREMSRQEYEEKREAILKDEPEDQGTVV